MKWLAIILSAFLFVGCAASRKTLSSSSESSVQGRDSVRVEYRERTILVPDTVFVEIPAQTAERTTLDSLSHLENEYAESDARINPDGSLFHNLRTKPQTKAVPTTKEIQERDNTEYRDREVEKIVKVKETVEVEVEKRLSWFQKTQMVGFWAFLCLFAIIYRKKIFGAILRLFLKK